MLERAAIEAAAAAAADRQCPGIKLEGTFWELLGSAAAFALKQPHIHTHRVVV